MSAMRETAVPSEVLEAFAMLDVRVGTVIEIQAFPEAKKPAYKLTIDFGEELGLRRSSAQITAHYTPEVLLGRQILGVINLPPKRIAGFVSDVLVLGVPDTNENVVLLRPDSNVENGVRMF